MYVITAASFLQGKAVLSNNLTSQHIRDVDLVLVYRWTTIADGGQH